MIQKKKILFLVHTEYHMTIALSLIADVFIDEEKFDISLYQTENYSKTRFQFDKNTNLLNHLSYHVMQYEERNSAYNEHLITHINTILDGTFDVFFMFNHHSFLPVYLAKQLYKKGTAIHLAPDGMKSYTNSNKLTLRWSIKTAIKYYKFLRINKLSYTWHYPRITYANLKEIEKVYVQFPEAYNNITNKKVEKVNVLHSLKSKELISNYFKFNISDELQNQNNIIFYLNIPAKNKDIYDFEIKILKELQNKFPDYRLLIKLHPSTEKKQLERFKALKNLHLIAKSYPAELYISELKKSIVISFWSTACLINNKSTKAYWLYPALIKNKIMLNFVNIINPTGHIEEIEEIEEIEWAR